MNKLGFRVVGRALCAGAVIGSSLVVLPNAAGSTVPEDTTPPNPPVAPADLFLQCAGDVPPPVELTAVDDFDGPITVSPAAQIFPGASPNDYFMTRTWTFTDQTGNFSAVTQNITVLDTTAPTAPPTPADITVTTDAVPPPISLTALDNCDGPITTSPSAVLTPGASANDYTVERTWTFTDVTGNSSSVSQTINVVEPELELTGCTIYATGTAAVFGTNGDDVICGDDANNIIYALGGNDIVLGFGGDDLIFLGNNGTGGVTVTADFGQSSWTISGAHDIAMGGAGNDRIYGGNGSDQIEGGTGDDQLWGQNDDDVLLSGANAFFETTTPGYPLWTGTPGDDKAVGGNGYDLCLASVQQTCELSLP